MNSVCSQCTRQAAPSCTAEGGPRCRNCCNCEAHRPRTQKRGGHSEFVKIRKSFRLKALSTIRTTLRCLSGYWRGCGRWSPEQTTAWKQDVLQFYFSRRFVDDLPDWDADGSVFGFYPVQGLPPAVYFLNFYRLVKLRRRAVGDRKGWPAERVERWRAWRNDMEASEDFRFGLEDDVFWNAMDATVFGYDASAPGDDDATSASDGDDDKEDEATDMDTASAPGAAASWTAEAEWAEGISVRAGSDSWWRDSEWASAAGGPAPSDADTDASCASWGQQPPAPPPRAPVPETADVIEVLKTFPLIFEKPPLIAPWPCSDPDLPHRPEYTPLSRTGRFMWDPLAQKPEPHVRRTVGRDPVENCIGSQATTWRLWGVRKLMLASYGPQPRSFAEAAKVLYSWIAARDELANVFESSRLVDPVSDFGMMYMTLPGCWLYLHKHGAQHPKDDPPEGHRWGFHGTSMYCVDRIFKGNTLHTGMASLEIAGVPLKGVYYHSAERAHLCQGTYMLYNGIGGGFFMAPLVVLDTKIQCVRPDGSYIKSVAPRGKKSQLQYVTYEDNHTLVGLLVHLIHASEVYRMPAAQWIVAEPGWIPELELDIQDTWEEIMERSRLMKDVPLGV